MNVFGIFDGIRARGRGYTLGRCNLLKKHTIVESMRYRSFILYYNPSPSLFLPAPSFFYCVSKLETLPNPLRSPFSFRYFFPPLARSDPKFDVHLVPSEHKSKRSTTTFIRQTSLQLYSRATKTSNHFFDVW